MIKPLETTPPFPNASHIFVTLSRAERAGETAVSFSLPIFLVNSPASSSLIDRYLKVLNIYIYTEWN